MIVGAAITIYLIVGFMFAVMSAGMGERWFGSWWLLWPVMLALRFSQKWWRERKGR